MGHRMKKSHYIVLAVVAILVILLGIGIYKYLPSLSLPAAASSKGSIVIWNKTDQEIEVAIRPFRGKVRSLSLEPRVRGYLAFSDEEVEKGAWKIRYLGVKYKKKRYKFKDTHVLNECPASGKPSGGDTRYFILMTLRSCDDRWEFFKERLSQDGVELDENYSYLMMSNHCKLGSPEDEDARLSVLKLSKR